MYYEKDGIQYGVLNDFDLAYCEDPEYDAKDRAIRTRNTDRTGTIPFMALELLRDIGQAGKLEHLYRHDSESFAWVQLWILARFDKGQEIDNPPFEDWTQGDALACFKEKGSLLMQLSEVEATPSWSETDWRAACELIRYWITFNNNKRGVRELEREYI